MLASFVNRNNSSESAKSKHHGLKTEADRQTAQGLKLKPSRNGVPPYSASLDGSPYSRHFKNGHAKLAGEVAPIQNGSDAGEGDMFDTDVDSHLEDTILAGNFEKSAEAQHPPMSHHNPNDAQQTYAFHPPVEQYARNAQAHSPLRRNGVISKETTRFVQAKEIQNQRSQFARQADSAMDGFISNRNPRKRSHQAAHIHYQDSHIGQDIEELESEDDGYDAEDNMTNRQAHDESEEYHNGNIKVHAEREENSVTPKRQGRQSQSRGNVSYGGWEEIDIDFTDQQLSQMTYEELEKRTPWDSASDTSVYHAPDILKGKSMAEKVDYHLQERESPIELFFASLNKDEWEEAGDHIMSRLAEVFKQFNEARIEKRKITEKYEQALKVKEERIRQSSAQIEKDLEIMKKGGEGLLRSKQ